MIGIIYQNKNSNKTKKQSEILEEVHKEITQMKQYSDKKDKEMNEKIDSIALASCKASLISLMSKIENGYIATDEEKRILHETYEYYTNHNGNSYVHSMYDRLNRQNLI